MFEAIRGHLPDRNEEGDHNWLISKQATIEGLDVSISRIFAWKTLVTINVSIDFDHKLSVVRMCSTHSGNNETVPFNPSLKSVISDTISSQSISYASTTVVIDDKSVTFEDQSAEMPFQKVGDESVPVTAISSLVGLLARQFEKTTPCAGIHCNQPGYTLQEGGIEPRFWCDTCVFHFIPACCCFTCDHMLLCDAQYTTEDMKGTPQIIAR